MMQQNNLSLSSQLRLGYINMACPHFNNDDFFITLTFKYDHAGDVIKRSRDIKTFLNRVDQEFFGKDGKFGKRKVKRCHTFELNYSNGIHVHMLMENPDSDLVPPEIRKDRILDVWLRMHCSGVREANKIIPIFDVRGALTYTFKDINRATEDRVDINNWYLGNTD